MGGTQFCGRCGGNEVEERFSWVAPPAYWPGLATGKGGAGPGRLLRVCETGGVVQTGGQQRL